MRLLRPGLITLATLFFAGRSTAQRIVPIDDNVPPAAYDPLAAYVLRHLPGFAPTEGQ